MNSKMKKTLPLLLLILMVLIIIPQTFATDPVATDDNSQTVTNDVEDIILNETPTDNHQVSESESIVNYDETKYWRMTVNPTAITYNSDSCTVDFTIDTSGAGASALYIYKDGVKTNYQVTNLDNQYAYANTEGTFTVNLATILLSYNVFDTDGVYEISFRPDTSATYMAFGFHGIEDPEFGSVTVTVGSGGSSSKTATTLTITTGTSIEEGTPIAGTLMAGTTPVSGATINYKFEGSSKTTTTDTDGSFEIDTDYATGTYSDFSYDGDDTYEGSSNSKTITVSAASFGSSDYVTTPTPNSISYTKGTSTKVNIAFEYPSDADFYSDSLKRIYVWIDPTDTTFSSSTGILVEGADASSSGYEFDLETIKDSLTAGEHTLYFGPHAPGLSGAEIYGDADYNPLTVTVSDSGSGSSKTATTLTIDNTGTTVAKGTPITGTLTDVNGDGISGATIKFTSTYGSSGASVTTGTDGKFSISTSSAIANSETYSGFEYEGDDTYEGSTSDKTFSVVPAPKIVNITVTPTTATYTAGSSSQLTGTLTISGGSFYSDNVIVWVDDDSSKYVKVQSLSVTTNPTTFTVDLNDLKDTDNDVDLSSVLATGSHTLHFSISSKSYYSSTWTIDEAEVTVTAASSTPTLKVTITEDSIEYTPGTDTIVHGTISYPTDWYTGTFRLYAWVNGDLSTQEQAWDEDGYAIDIVNGEFTVNLRELTYQFKSGKSYNLTFGPQNGAENSIIEYYGATLDLDNVTVTIPGTVKTDTDIILDNSVVVEGSTINGKLVDENNNALTGKTISISLKLPSGLTESSEATTGSDGTFKVSNAKVGVYTFTFAEDDTYSKATNKTTVTYANKKVVVTVTEDNISYKKGEDTILHGTISGVASYMFYSGDTELYVWVNGDLSTQEIVYDEDGYKVDMANGAFTANLKLMDFNFEVGETYTLTFGPKDGVNNAILISDYYLYSADLDNVTVKVTDKNPSKITLDETSIKATQDITGKLTDNSDNGIASATIKFVKPDGTSDTVTTGSDGTFTISSAIEGTYSNFEFEGDTTYEGVVASSNVTVSGPEATTLTVNKIDDTVFVGKTITGMLTDSEDTGIADAVIKYTGPNGADTVTTDSTGAFTISNVELGEYKDFSFEATIDYQAASVNGAVTVISTPTYNGIIYVSKSGSDSNDGSESSPVATIAKAIELAEYTLDHKIIVSAGTYREHDLSINDALSITGVGNVIIDANKQGKIFNIDTAEEVSLTNLTLINGKSTTDGGAISIKDAKVIIDGLTFRNNMVAKDDGTLAGYGGAISWNADEGLLINSVFINNSARMSGAVNWGDMYSSGATGGDIINCTFDSNYATSKTGALSLYIPANVINSTFKNNNASDPSGIATQVGALYVYASNSLITGSEFINNYASGYGGAIVIDTDSDGTVINDTKFINNTGNRGGAIEAQGSNIVIANSTFINNHATYDGGAVDLLLNWDSDEGVFINNNIFESNVADNDGGAIYSDGSESYGYDAGVFLEENTFTKNSARNGGAISADSNSVLDLKNNEFTSNVASVSGGAIKDGKLTLEGNTANDNEAPVGACIYLETGSIESDVTLTYSSISALSGDTVTLTAILTDDNGNSIVLYGNSYYPGVYFTVEGNDVLGTVTYNSENMTIEYEVTQSTGDYTISGSVDSDFADSVTVVDGTLSVVEELETVLTVENQTINYGTSFTGTLTDINGKPLAGKEITYTYKGNTLTVTTDDEGVFTISSAREGIYSDFAFAGDDSYTESTSDAVVTVREQVIPTPTIVNVTITDSSLTVNNGTVSVHVSPSDDSIVNSGSVSLTVDGVTYSSNVTNGVATFNLNLISGNYSALVDYIAIGNYTNASKNLTVIVPTTNNTNDTNHTNVTTNVSTIITLEFEELETGHEIRGKLTDANGNLLNGNVDIALSRLSSGASKTYTVTCTNGEFVLPLHLAPGDYSAKATYNGEGNYLPNSTGVKYIALTDKPSNVILNDSDEVTGVYGENNTFGGVLTDKEGNALAGYHLALNITRLSSGASKIYYVTTDYNGNYVLPINLAPGYYTVRTTIDDKNYTGASLSSLIIRSNDSDVDNRSETIINIVSSVINYTTGGNLSGKLLNTAGYGIAGQHVDVTLANSRGASKTYNLVTDYTGSFNLPINLARGSYTAVCTYDGTATYAPSKTGTITVSVI